MEYFIGIDFGHGETCVSRVPGYDNEDVSRILLRRTAFVKDQKVMSAICQKEGNWQLVFSKEDFKSSNLREGFKGPISKLKKDDPEALFAFKEFGKLVFSTILKNDTDLIYNEETGDANFVICIANPSEWRRADSKTPQEYLDFFKNECGIKPAILCINESDAAFYTKFSKQNSKYSAQDTVFVIDLGSSTIDFTTYNNTNCIIDGCWGHNLGAHIIEDKILSEGLKTNKSKLMRAKELRDQKHIIGDLNAALSLYARKAKEDYYTNHDSTFELIIRMRDLVPSLKATDPESTDNAFVLILEKEDFENVIKEYKYQLELALKNAAEQLKNKVMTTPQFIILSGGASRMDFVEELTKKYFPDAKIDLDPTPEWVVSNGAAKYIQAQQTALDQLRESIRAIDYKSIYKDADITATQKATKALMPSVINGITGDTNLDGYQILEEFCKFFFELNPDNKRYVNIFTETANSLLKERIYKSIKEVVLNAFKVDVDMSDVSIFYDFEVMYWPLEFWSTFEHNGETYLGQGCRIVSQAIDDSSGRINFTWDKKRNKTERQRIVEGCLAKFSVRDPFGVSFNEESLNKAVHAIREQTLEIAEKLFHEKELFRTSNHK